MRCTTRLQCKAAHDVGSFSHGSHDSRCRCSHDQRTRVSKRTSSSNHYAEVSTRSRFEAEDDAVDFGLALNQPSSGDLGLHDGLGQSGAHRLLPFAGRLFELQFDFVLLSLNAAQLTIDSARLLGQRRGPSTNLQPDEASQSVQANRMQMHAICVNAASSERSKASNPAHVKHATQAAHGHFTTACTNPRTCSFSVGAFPNKDVITVPLFKHCYRGKVHKNCSRQGRLVPNSPDEAQSFFRSRFLACTTCCVQLRSCSCWYALSYTSCCDRKKAAGIRSCTICKK